MQGKRLMLQPYSDVTRSIQTWSQSTDLSDNYDLRETATQVCSCIVIRYCVVVPTTAPKLCRDALRSSLVCFWTREVSVQFQDPFRVVCCSSGCMSHYFLDLLHVKAIHCP